MRHPDRIKPPAAAGAAMAGSIALAALAALAAEGAAHAEGRDIVLAAPPVGAESWMRACSLRHPVCVHGAPGTPDTALLAAIDALDRAFSVETQALELPAADAGMDGTWDAYLVDGVPEGGRAELSSRDPRGSLDRGTSFGLIDRANLPGCTLDVAAARALAWASMLRAAPATDLGTARAQTRMLARLTTACAAPDEDERAFQAEPERTIVDPEGEARSSGAGLFFEWLDQSFAGEPGSFSLGTWALAPTKTPAAATRWPVRPTVFDVIGSSLAGVLGTDSGLDDVFLHYGIDRGLTPPAARLAWHVPWPDHARRLASPVPVAPTGASYVLIDHAGAPPGASLRVQAMWEDYGRMKWAVIKLDTAGRPLAVLPIASSKMATSTALTVELVDAVDRFLVVGVNVGSTEHPFDPGQGWWEPHGWVLAISPG
jgi:hypothetical protein